MIYLFVLDDSLSSYRFTTRTEHLAICYELLQKMRVGLGYSVSNSSSTCSQNFKHLACFCDCTGLFGSHPV